MKIKPQNINQFFINTKQDKAAILRSLLDFDFSSFEPKLVETVIGFGEKFLEVLDKNINADYYDFDSQFVVFVDFDLVEYFLKNSTVEILKDIVLNFETVATALSFDDQVDSYSKDKLLEFLRSKYHDNPDLEVMHALRQEIKNRYDRDLVKAAEIFIGNFERYKELELGQVAFLSLALNLVWKNFMNITDAEKKFLLDSNLVLSLLVGLPAKKYLEQFVYDTANPIDFTLRQKFLFDAVAGNQESILVDLNNNLIDLKDIVAVFEADSSDLNKVISQFVSAQDSVEFVVLEKFLSIYSDLKQAKLIEKNYAGETTPEDHYIEVMSNLIYQFFDSSKWGEMVLFLKNPGNQSFLLNFLIELKKAVDLDKEEAVQKMASFNAYLLENNVLSEQKEIIEYHESDGKFHWSDWIK